MTGKQLYERFLTKPWNLGVVTTTVANSNLQSVVAFCTPQMWLRWEAVPPDNRRFWEDIAAEVTSAIAQRNPVYPVTDDEIMSWIEAQKPNVLARIYQILHSMGYRI